MRRAHHTDAHFVCYNLRDSPEWPRLRKVCLPHILQAGDAVVLPYIAIDIDNPDHAPWGDITEVSEFLDLFEEYEAAGWWPAAEWSYLYTTRAGVRIFYTLKEALSPEEWERCARSLIAEFKQENFGVDPACKDWTRIFRLPDVMRDGEPQGMQHWFVLCEHPERRLDIRTRVADSTADFDSLFPRRKAEPALDLQPVGDQPDQDTAHALLHRRMGANREVATEWYKNAKKALSGQTYFPALFEHQPLAGPGNRDTTLLKTAGSVVSLLYGRFGTSINHVYALLLEAVEGFDPDVGTPDWTKATWDKVQMIWQKEDAKARVARADEKAAEKDKLNRVDQMLVGMNEWCDHPDLTHPDPEKAYNFLYSHLIAFTSTGNIHYVMRPDGYYETLGCSAPALVSRIRALHGDDLVNLRLQTAKSSRWVTPAELVNAHGTAVSEVSMHANRTTGGMIDNIDGDLSNLRISRYSRNSKLKAIYDPHVDKWMHLLFGENYDIAARWVAWALAFEEGPICAFSICGPTGVGKTLFIEGLKEVLTNPCASDFSELMGDWQYELTASPFVFSDEGFDINYMKVHPADQFRRIIGGNTIKAKQKYRAPVTIHTDARLAFTGNNHQLIRMLVSEQEGLSPQDREALMIRLLHLDVDSAAADWLAAQGGRRFTNLWISDGKMSQYIVAQHFLWLYEQREAMGKDDRLLVEGNLTEAVMNELRLHSNNLDLVLEAVAHMIEAPDGSRRKGSTRVDGENVYVLVADVHKYITKDLNSRLGISQVRDLLGNLLPKRARDEKGNVKVKAIAGDRKRWYSIDVEFLKQTCNEYGWNVPTLFETRPSFPIRDQHDDTAPPLKFRLTK